MFAMVGASRRTELVGLNPEWAQIISGWVGSRAEVTMFGGTRLSWPLSTEEVLAMAEEPGREVYVLLDQQRLPVATGSVLIKADGSARIGRVLVDPQRRGEGFGRDIMEALIEYGEAQSSVGVIRLGVYEHNTVAQGLYERLGFKATSEHRHAVAVEDGARWVSVQLERPVSP